MLDSGLQLLMEVLYLNRWRFLFKLFQILYICQGSRQDRMKNQRNNGPPTDKLRAVKSAGIQKKRNFHSFIISLVHSTPRKFIQANGLRHITLNEVRGCVFCIQIFLKLNISPTVMRQPKTAQGLANFLDIVVNADVTKKAEIKSKNKKTLLQESLHLNTCILQRDPTTVMAAVQLLVIPQICVQEQC